MTNNFAHIVKCTELIPQHKRWCVGSTQVADSLCHPVVAGISQRREYHRRRVGKKAEYAQQPQLLCQSSFHHFTLFKKYAVLDHKTWSALRLCVWLIYFFNPEISRIDNALTSALWAEKREILQYC